MAVDQLRDRPHLWLIIKAKQHLARGNMNLSLGMFTRPKYICVANLADACLIFQFHLADKVDTGYDWIL